MGRLLRERAATPSGKFERLRLGSGDGSGANLTVGMCPSEKHVDEREGFDEIKFVLGKIDDEAGDGVCLDESLVATSWASSRRVAMDMVWYAP